jgi:hypothetical protein
MTTVTAPLESTRLFHDEALTTMAQRLVAGRKVFVAASTIAAGRGLMQELQYDDTINSRPDRSQVRYYWAHDEERVTHPSGGCVIFSSINSSRIQGWTTDVAFVDYRASDGYLEWLLPALVLGGTLEPELFEIDA